MLKRSFYIQMTYDISDTEIMYAEQALQAFEFLLKSIENFELHLKKMEVPFSESQDITPEQIWKVRPEMRDFRDRAIENLNKVKKVAFKCVSIMSHFMSDTQVEKIMNSFNMCIDDVTKQFDRFVKLFDSLQSKDFKDNSVKCIQAVLKETVQLRQIIEERVQKYLETDILAKSWIDSAGELDLELDEQEPFERQLLDAQREKLERKKE